MSCTSCGRTNPVIARFCAGCGKPLAPRCPACGVEHESDARFCIACGAPLGSHAAHAAETAETRKVVTVVFADLIGSTALHERLDPESVSRVMDRYHRAVRAPVEAHGGTVVQLLGDGVMCAFGVPRVAEDDAIRAVRAAVGIQQAFREFAREERAVVGSTGLRVAVNTGEVVVSDDYAAGIGDPLNVAARLQQEAQDGDVLIAESTERLVRELMTLAPVGTFALKGRSETVTAYRVVSLERPSRAPASAFVGREEELRRILAVYDAAIGEPGARLVTILGSPGLGKSRLMDEVARRLGDRATVLAARCDATGAATFAPVATALRTLLGIDDEAGGDDLRVVIEAAIPGDESERLRIAAGVAALIAGSPASPEETFFVVRRFLAALTRVRPVVLVIDDLQWAEALLLDLTEHLVQWSSGVPLLVLVAGRPELRDARSSLAAAGGLVSDVVTLGGLDAGAATRLAANVIGADELPAAIAGRVLATSEGNPLFVGELVRMLVHDGALRREGDRWVTRVEPAALEMPPTIQALLAARIERLRPEERTVLERAAVIGRQFSRAALAHLLPREVTDLDARLEALRRSELIAPDAGWFLGEPSLRFHHGLTRDAAYRRVLKGTRAELHGRLADWFAARVGETVEHDETIGWHLEQAHRHLSELGPLDANGRAFGERAARYLAAAGRRALARDDLPLAASLLGRALDRLDPADPARADLALDWCEALLAAGDVGPAARAIDELGRFIGGSERLRAWHTCFAGERAALTNPQALHDTAEAVAAAAEDLASVGDAAGEAKAHSVHALALARLGRVGASEAALDKALAAARRGGDRRRANAVLAGAPLAALWGPSPVARASGRCLDVVRVLRITQGAPTVEAVALRCQAVLEALRGRAEAARRMIASSRRMVEELGITQGLLETEFFAGLVALIEEDTAAAEQSFRAAYDGLRNHGLGIDAARAAALLGRTLLEQDRAAEAEALSHESEALAGDDLQAAISWRRVRAEALARRGECAAAVDFARAAVDIAAATDALLHHADARLALAAALRAAGRHAEAGAEEARAIELWEAKGATARAESARRTLGRVEQVERAPDDRAGPARPVRRRAGANTATANGARLHAAIAARDADALAALWAEESEVVDHTTGAVFDRQGALSSFRSRLSAQAPTCVDELLATLGDSLALYRSSMSGSRFAGSKFDVGAYERDEIALVEVDAQGRRRRVEIFAADRLGDAIPCLYERYAELLAGGPAHARAAATARSVAALLGPADRWPFAPDAEATDHRTVGFGAVHGAEAILQAVRALLELTTDFSIRIDDVLALRSDALVVRWTNSGTDRYGGAFARHLCQLWIFGADGLPTRWEQFDAEQDAEALARFDELTAEPAMARLAAVPSRVARKLERRVRPNAATANAARVDAAIAAQDVDAFPSLWADESEAVGHETRTTWGRQGSLTAWRSMLRVRDPMSRHEPLATLGDSLALCRWSTSASGFAGRTFDVGAYEREEITLVEVDAQGRRRRTEAFAVPRLGDAIIRLYERWAELLAGGSAHARAAATARAAAAALGPYDLDVYATAFSPTIETVDHRILATWSARGAEALLQHYRSQLALADAVVLREDDVLDLQSDALLVRRTHLGRDRRGGGAYEKQFLALFVFGSDGLLTRIEWFDADCDAEALARFDELTAEPRMAPPATRRVRPNAVTAHAARVDSALGVRDPASLQGLIAEGFEAMDHTTGVTYGREGAFASYGALLRARDPTCRHEPLATLGDSLALFRLCTSANGFVGRKFDVGAYDREEIALYQLDAHGRRWRSEIFSADHLGDAIARLYERYAELLPDDSARARATATARSLTAHLGPLDLDRFAAALAPAVESLDHRIVGFGSAHGLREFRAALSTLFELADDVANRVDDVLTLRADALLLRVTNVGTDRAAGGAYERPFLALWIFGADGLVTYLEQFDLGHEVEALARFDELTAERLPARPLGRRVRPNAATANAARIDTVVAGRDADALPALFVDEYEAFDRTTGVTYDRQGELSSIRALVRAQDPTLRQEPLATLGDALALFRVSMAASAFAGGTFDVGAYEIEVLDLIEVDAQGRRRRSERFAVDRLGDAVARLYERYADLLTDGPAHARAAATARSVAAMLVGFFNPDRWATAFAPGIEVIDHRTLGTFSVCGADALAESFRAWLDVADNCVIRENAVLGLRPDACLLRRTFLGTARAGGGAFERSFVTLWVFGSDGLMVRIEYFEADRDDEALARFDEIGPSGAEGRAIAARAVRFENAVTRLNDRFVAAWAARDWEGIAAIFAPAFRLIDRRRYAHLDLDRDQHLESLRIRFAMRSSRTTLEVLATRGHRLALNRNRFELADGDVGPSETESLCVAECDEHAHWVALATFDPDDLDAAYAELDRRYAAGEAAAYGRVAAGMAAFLRAIAARDWDAMSALLSPSLVVNDHRRLGWETLGPTAYLKSLKSLVDLAPDVRLRGGHMSFSDRAALGLDTWVGTREGGAFEAPRAVVFEFDVGGRIRGMDFYDPEQIDEARARFDALGEGGQAHPFDGARDPLAALARPNAATAARDRVEAAFEALRIPPNAATRTTDRSLDALVARDWEAVAATCAPSLVFEDRRRRIRTTGDRAMFIANCRRVGSAGARVAHTVLATSGDRLALIRLRWDAARGEPEFELEHLLVAEVDSEGRAVAVILLDTDDRRAASAELRDRYARSDATWAPAAVFEGFRAFNDHDLDRFRATLHDDFVFHDHRRTGFGTLARADYIASIPPLFEGAPDICSENLYYIATEKDCSLALGRDFGTLRDGGEFESVYARIAVCRDDRIIALEQFELEHLDRARARFEELSRLA